MFLKIEWFQGYTGIIWTDDLKYRSSSTEVFLGKDVLKICSKFSGDHPCQSVISIKLLCNFIAIKLWYGCSPINYLFSEHFCK